MAAMAPFSMPAGESHITKGTAKLIIDIVNDEKQSEVAKLNVEDFTVLGIKELLTIQRQNGLGHLLNRIIKIAKVDIKKQPQE